MSSPGAQNPDDFTGTDRFVLERRLGSGGFGVVFEAFDRERGGLVALKALRRDRAESLYRFKQEFRALVDMTHPNLVQLYELLAEGDQWFFTMELVRGVSFLERFQGHSGPDGDTSPMTSLEPTPTSDAGDPRSAPGTRVEIPFIPRPASPSDWEALRRALLQLVDGVSALHAAGMLHGDIKPSNVLVTAADRLVLLDFGLAREVGADASAAVVGTPAYMSPEQAAGQELTEASDWYNVGVMLYEALTGRVPFTGPSAQVLVAKQRSDPPPPDQWTPSVPEAWNALCVELLDRDPRARPSAGRILERLGARGKDRVAVSAAAGAPRPLVGRGPHLAALGAAFRRSREGHAVIAYVHGASGMGKTALIRRFLQELQWDEKDVVVLAGRCYETESVPYKALDSLVDGLGQHLRRLPRTEAEALLPRDVHALARLFPVLALVEAVSPSAPGVEIPDPQELRRRAFGALRELLARLAERAPLVLFVDDLHWGDADSAALIRELLRPPEPPAALLIGSYRTEDAETSPLLKALLPIGEAAGWAADVREIVVGELQPREARDLAERLLVKEGLPTGRIETVVKEAAGSPFFIDALVRHGGTGGGSFEDLIARRMAMLHGDASRLMEVVSVAGQPVDLKAAVRAAEIPWPGLEALSRLRAARLARTRQRGDREEVEAYHDRIREAVVLGLDAPVKAGLHRRLALGLEASGTADPERLALHFQAGGEPEKAARYAIDAAERAARALAFDRAARLYRLALELRAWEAPAQRKLRLSLGDALANAGRGPEAAEEYLGAVAGASPVEAIELQRRAAQQLLISGHIDEGLAVLRSVLAQLRLRMPLGPRRVFAEFLLRQALLRLRGLRFRRRDPLQISPERLLRIDTCWSLAMGMGLVDTLQGASFQARHLLLALKAGEPYRVARAVAMEIPFSAIFGGRGRRRTAKLMATARALADEVDAPHARALVDLTCGIAGYLEGRWRDARDLCARAEATLQERCTGVAWELDMSQVFLVRSLMFLGELRLVGERVSSLLKEARVRGDLLAATYFGTDILYMARLAADRAGAARDGVLGALRNWPHHGFDQVRQWAFHAQVQIALYEGDEAAARSLVREQWPALEGSLFLQIQLVRVVSLDFRARAALAGAWRAGSAARRSELIALAEADAGGIAAERMSWADPLAEALLAGAATARDDREGALRRFEAAERGFRAAEMALHAAVCRRRRGELLGPASGAGLVSEAEVWMAAQGIRNPERMAGMLAPGPA